MAASLLSSWAITARGVPRDGPSKTPTHARAHKRKSPPEMAIAQTRRLFFCVQCSKKKRENEAAPWHRQSPSFSPECACLFATAPWGESFVRCRQIEKKRVRKRDPFPAGSARRRAPDREKQRKRDGARVHGNEMRQQRRAPFAGSKRNVAFQDKKDKRRLETKICRRGSVSLLCLYIFCSSDCPVAIFHCLSFRRQQERERVGLLARETFFWSQNRRRRPPPKRLMTNKRPMVMRRP